MTAIPASLLRLRPGQAAGQSPRGCLTVALVNNMPDAAVTGTERQFAALLAAASEGLTLRLQLFSPPVIARGAALRERLDRHYEDFATLEQNPPDALIVTGAEPKAARLQDEPLWPVLSRLADFAEAERIPTIWSCMAAHAATLRLDGPARAPLPAKLSGLFRCRIRRRGHAWLRGLAGCRHMMPHSRLSGIDAGALQECGFEILSHGAQAGVDIFARTGRAPHLFFQGHPEYGPTTLLAEYRRDVARFLAGEREALPAPPDGYYGEATRSQLARFEAAALRRRDPALLERFDAVSLDLSTPHAWSPIATQLYRNWLIALDRRGQRQGAASGWLPGFALPAWSARLDPLDAGQLS